MRYRGEWVKKIMLIGWIVVRRSNVVDWLPLKPVPPPYSMGRSGRGRTRHKHADGVKQRIR